MAIVPIHRAITVRVLRGFGFQEWALDAAADANARVDEKQGQLADETNLHAMLGVDPGTGVMQSRDQGVRAVDDRLERLREEVLGAIAAGQYRRALAGLGEASHTIQDREYHGFEPWPFSGIGDSFLNARAGATHGLRPDYMLGHAVRDLSFVTGMNYGAGFTSGSGWSGAYWLELTLPTGRGLMPYLSLGSYGSTGITGRSPEVAGYVAFTWGAPPRSVRTPPTLLETEPWRGAPQRSFCEEVGDGLGAFERAITRTREYVDRLRAPAGREWDPFVRAPAAAG